MHKKKFNAKKSYVLEFVCLVNFELMQFYIENCLRYRNFFLSKMRKLLKTKITTNLFALL